MIGKIDKKKSGGEKKNVMDCWRKEVEGRWRREEGVKGREEEGSGRCC